MARNPKLTPLLILADLKAGRPLDEVADTHNVPLDEVEAIYTENATEIEEAFEKLARTRQQRLAAAFEAENEALVRCLGKSSELLESILDAGLEFKKRGVLLHAVERGVMRPRDLVQIHKQIRNTVMTYHKTSPDTLENEEIPDPLTIPTRKTANKRP